MSISAIICASLAVLYAHFVGFLVAGLLRLRDRNSSRQPFVSVVMAVRDEAASLPRCLSALSSQTYPPSRMEMIVVNNLSQDNTRELLDDWQADDENRHALHLHDIPAGCSPKKFALTRGINKAAGELIFTTDADCAPSPDWLESMVGYFRDDTGVVVGPAPLEGESLLAKILALDSLASLVVAAGGCGWQTAITCTGRNLAYRKSVFKQVGGFSATAHRLSGDDDLFLQSVSRQTDWSIDFALKAQSVVPSPAAESFRQFVRQRRRHVSASKDYPFRLKAAYLIFNLANLGIFACLSHACITGTGIAAATAVLGLKLMLDFVALALVAYRLERTRLLFYFPLWELFYIINQTLISPLGLIGKIRW